MKYRLLYFASLRDRSGCDAETVESAAADPRALFAEVASRHGWSLPMERLRVAINGAFCGWETALRDGDEIVFIPPVSGG
ncbi:MoaD/ThiS family protein [Tahibacter amnicola]|uniref:Molybdopterin synthase sulfur carrier subunit n=1 Tax=Tahibacter amnicola TaxID=2976241 RepID=A0ABY6BJ67_9GAMM|nr:MoaD/ThiS family protein [Tahibacter amnicola]UXI69631.1 MoaD/ThiS family protein [Tahibacter amnicola]